MSITARRRKRHGKMKFTGNAKPKTLKGRFSGARIALTALAASAAIGGTYGIISHMDRESDSGKITIATVKDIEGDEYNNYAPLFSDDQMITLLEDGSIIFVDESIEPDNGMYDTLGFSEDGEIIHGVMSEDYFDRQTTIDKAKLEEYNHVFEVSGADVVNVRADTTLDKESRIGTITEGMQVIGGDRVVSRDNDFMWVPVLTEDNAGNIVEAYICYDYLRELDNINISFQEPVARKVVVDIYSENLNLRSSAEKTDNIIAKIPNKSVVETLGTEDRIGDTIKWTEIKYIDENGQEYTGCVMNSALAEYNLVSKKVNTDKSRGINLNVRSAPGLSSDKIADIENGTVIEVSEFDIESMEKVDDIDWVRIALNDGSYGYVAYQYLEDVREKDNGKTISNEELKNVFEKKRVNSNGKVVGMDISSLAGDDLRRVLTDENAIPSSVYRIDGENENEYDTSDLAGKVDFVFIKIGARAYGESGALLDCGDTYIEQARICEELGIPYGFYYYSTSLNEQEADEEINYIKRALNSLDDDRKYNILPFALDVEANSASRLYGKDVTDVMSYWANQAEPITGKVILYGGAKDMANNSGERVIDLDRFNANLVSGPTRLWVAALRTRDNSTTYGQDYVEDITSRGMNVDIEQTMLDGYNDSKGLPNSDIDIIDADEYEQMITDRVNEIRRENNEEVIEKNNVTKENETKHKTPFDSLKDLFNRDDGDERE